MQEDERMKKLTRKQIVTIVVSAVIVVALIITGIVLGTRSNNNENKIDTDKKVESVEKEDKKETEDSKTEETEKADAVVSETTENTMEQETDTQTPVVEEPKQETQQQTTTNANQNTNNGNTENNSGNSSGNTTTPTPTTTPEPTPEPSPYASMYAVMDDAAKSRLLQCYDILCSGMASQFVPTLHEYNSVEYWNGKIVLCADAVSGSWMYVVLAGWYADTTNVGSDETRPGYAEIPSLVKRCLEALAPEGGTELYYTINSLVSQYGADYLVPTQGTITESIPGLYVTLEDGKNGLEIRFWAE